MNQASGLARKKTGENIPISLLVKARAILLTFCSTIKWVTQVSDLARNKGQEYNTYFFACEGQGDLVDIL